MDRVQSWRRESFELRERSSHRSGFDSTDPSRSLNPKLQGKNMKAKSRYFFITAAFLSFVLSVSIWFFFENELQAIYVGIWVPSILSLGRYFD